MPTGKRSKTSKGTTVSKDKLVQCERCDMWQELGRGDLANTSHKTVSREGYSYVCTKCKEVHELRNKLQEKQSGSQRVITNKESNNNNAGKKNKVDKGKERPDTLIVGDSIVRG